MISIDSLKFTYPKQSRPILDIQKLSVRKGEFVLLCGESGCGKTTLMRLLKPGLEPAGKTEGAILFDGKTLSELSQRDASSKIGFVQQLPENQIVTDKVWHELAFGMENLGMDTASIRKKTAEMAEFFGIENWFYKDISELSGGQKQLLNLAAVMTLDPDILIMDEPTSQLDPIAAGEFLSALSKVNREFGIAVLLSEHRLEEAFVYADRVVVMDHGHIECDAAPQKTGKQLLEKKHPMFTSMPSAMQIWGGLTDNLSETAPVTVREGRDFLLAYQKAQEDRKPHRTQKENQVPLDGYAQADEAECRQAADSKKNVVIEAQDLYFRYEKDGPDVIRGLDLTIYKGEFVSFLGGNGTGKSTAMKLICSQLTPYRGSISVEGKAAYLPQDPKTLFVADKVIGELSELSDDPKRMNEVIGVCHLESLLDRHPYDLSGGEQQRLGLAKILLTEADILLLDEPTKGMDGKFKRELAEILQNLLKEGKTILMVSHDADFCASYTDRCEMFFQGKVIAEALPREFFSGNRFYTTAASRISRGITDSAVTVQQVLEAFGKGERNKKVQEQTQAQALTQVQIEAEEETGPAPKLPKWRKLLAGISLSAAILIIIKIASLGSLSELIRGNEATEVTMQHIPWYLALLVSLLLLMLAFGTKGNKGRNAEKAEGSSRKWQKLSRGRVAAIILCFSLIPFTVLAGAALFGNSSYYLISFLVLLECMIPVFLLFEGKKPQPRELVMIASIIALVIAGRAAFFALPGFTPVFAVVYLSGIALGPVSGFMVGAVSMLLSNFLFGQGPWTPWQMFSMGLIGLLGGLIYSKGRLEQTRISISVSGALLSLLLYGGIMNYASALMAGAENSIPSILVYYVAGLPVDLLHGAATFVFLWFFAQPFLEKTQRIKIKFQ